MSTLRLSPWLAMLVAAALSALALGILHRVRGRLPVDHPGARSLHDRPVLRVGGLAIWVGFLPVAALAPPPVPGGAVWLAAWGAVTVVSLADDWRGVPAWARLAVHAVAALAVAGSMVRPGDPDALGATGAMALAAFALVWSANLFNFMDGSDGLAALMAACGFGAYGAAAMRAGAPADAYLALATATLPFLVVNLPPARMFMGDGGAVPLGFLAAVFGLAGIRTGMWPAWFPLLVFLPFIADTLATIIRRIAARENLFRAHKTHYYQRLHQLGAGHVGTLLFYGVLISGTCGSALLVLATGRGAGWPVLGAWAIAIGALFTGIDIHWRRRSPG